MVENSTVMAVLINGWRAVLVHLQCQIAKAYGGAAINRQFAVLVH
jgi:hypothetical protein